MNLTVVLRTNNTKWFMKTFLSPSLVCGIKGSLLEQGKALFRTHVEHLAWLASPGHQYLDSECPSCLSTLLSVSRGVY